MVAGPENLGLDFASGSASSSRDRVVRGVSPPSWPGEALLRESLNGQGQQQHQQWEVVGVELPLEVELVGLVWELAHAPKKPSSDRLSVQLAVESALLAEALAALLPSCSRDGPS